MLDSPLSSLLLFLYIQFLSGPIIFSAFQKSLQEATGHNLYVPRHNFFAVGMNRLLHPQMILMTLFYAGMVMFHRLTRVLEIPNI